MNNKILGVECRNFRIEVLEKTLKEVEGSEDIQLLSAFEHGRSTNYRHVFKYISACNNKGQTGLFMERLKFIAKHYY